MIPLIILFAKTCVVFISFIWARLIVVAHRFYTLLFSSSLVLLYNTRIRCFILSIRLLFTLPVTEVIK